MLMAHLPFVEGELSNTLSKCCYYSSNGQHANSATPDLPLQSGAVDSVTTILIS